MARSIQSLLSVLALALITASTSLLADTPNYVVWDNTSGIDVWLHADTSGRGVGTVFLADKDTTPENLSTILGDPKGAKSGDKVTDLKTWKATKKIYLRFKRGSDGSFQQRLAVSDTNGEQGADFILEAAPGKPVAIKERTGQVNGKTATFKIKYQDGEPDKLPYKIEYGASATANVDKDTFFLNILNQARARR